MLHYCVPLQCNCNPVVVLLLHVRVYTFRFSSFVKTGTETYVLGRITIKAPISETEKVKVVLTAEGEVSYNNYDHVVFRLQYCLAGMYINVHVYGFTSLKLAVVTSTFCLWISVTCSLMNTWLFPRLSNMGTQLRPIHY